MNAEGQDLGESLCWCVSVENTVLNRPWSPAGTVLTFPQWQASVLMPSDKPI